MSSKFDPLKYKAVGDYVLLRAFGEEKESGSGIILLSNTSNISKGIVIAKSKQFGAAMGIKVNDVVLFAKKGFREIEHNKQKYFVGKYEHILASI